MDYDLSETEEVFSSSRFNDSLFKRSITNSAKKRNVLQNLSISLLPNESYDEFVSRGNITGINETLNLCKSTLLIFLINFICLSNFSQDRKS